MERTERNGGAYARKREKREKEEDGDVQRRKERGERAPLMIRPSLLVLLFLDCFLRLGSNRLNKILFYCCARSKESFGTQRRRSLEYQKPKCP